MKNENGQNQESTSTGQQDRLAVDAAIARFRKEMEFLHAGYTIVASTNTMEGFLTASQRVQYLMQDIKLRVVLPLILDSELLSEDELRTVFPISDRIVTAVVNAATTGEQPCT